MFRSKYKTKCEARAHIFDYIEWFYIPRLLRSTLDRLSPVEFDKRNATFTVYP